MTFSNKKIIVIALVAILGAVSVAQALLITRTWDPLWNPFRPSPEAILAAAWQNGQERKTAKADIQLGMDFLKEGTSLLSIQARLITESDETDPTHPLSKGAVEGKMRFEGVEISFDTDYKVIGETWYFKIKTFPFPSLLQHLFGSGVEKLRNQWIAVDAAEFSGSTAQQRELEKKLQDKYTKMFEEGRLLTAIQQLPDERVAGKSAYHLRAALNAQAISEIYEFIFQETQSENAGQPFAGDYPKSYPRPEIFAEQFNQFFGGFEEIPIDIWVEKRGMLPSRIAVQTALTPKASDEFGVDLDSIAVDLRVDLSNLSMPLEIQAPQDAKTFEEIAAEIEGGY